MIKGIRIWLWILSLLLLLILIIVSSATIGAVQIEPLLVAKIFFSTIFDLKNKAPDTYKTIIFHIRLPRIMLGVVVGFALSSAGVVMQGFFRNPMADPSIIGVSSGAAVGAVLVIISPFTIPFGLNISAFLGAIITAFLVYMISTRNGKTPIAKLLLVGIAVQTFLGAVISFLLVNSGRALRQAMYWLMGNLHNSSWDQVILSAYVVLPCFFLLFMFSKDLNLLLLGEEDAETLGVEVEKTKKILLVLASIITAAVVSVSGIIGFVGLIIPHIMRLIVGPDHKILLPTSALAGSSFLVITDTIARSGAAEIPVGIITAFLGAPFFLYLLRKKEVDSL